MAKAINERNLTSDADKRRLRRHLDVVKKAGWGMWEIQEDVFFEPAPKRNNYLTEDPLRCPDCEKTDKFTLHCTGAFDIVCEAGREEKVEVDTFDVDKVSCGNCNCTGYIETFRT
jgi:hypothetical protein